MTRSDLESTKAIERLRRKWKFCGQDRPDFAHAPGKDCESVWDYPRPPRIVPDTRRIEVRHGDRLVAQSTGALRILETASPPTFYLPPGDVRLDWLVESGAQSHCEWKGIARDLDLVEGPGSVAWCYPRTYPEFAAIAGWIACYPARLACSVDGERVRPQPGGFYGGWITDEIVGPFKGEPGCEGF